MNVCPGLLRDTTALESGRASLAIALMIAACAMAPLLSLCWLALHGTSDHWVHLARHVIPGAALNTLLLLCGVGLLVVCIGTGAAWLVSAYQFPGRCVLVWALLLPLAVPTYIVAYAYMDLLHPIGPVQEILRGVLGYTSPRQFRLPDLRSLPGAIAVLGCVLYPYVYLSARYMFMTQAASLIEVARSLGETPRGVFLRVALPLARPAIVLGTTLALFETLNDIGASEFLGIQTLTLAAYTTWVTRSDLAGAAQIALGMVGVCLFLVALERHARKRQRYANADRMRPFQRQRLTGATGLMAGLLGWAPVIAGFGVPGAYLLAQSVHRLRHTGAIPAPLLQAALNTLLIATAVTTLAVTCGIVLAWTARLWREPATPRPGRICLRLSALGYALPGTVLAIGLLAPYALADAVVNSVASLLSTQSPTLWLSGSLAGLVIACTIRFLAISSGALEAGFARIPVSLDQAARGLGHSALSTLCRVDLPLLRPAIAAAAMLVFVDAMKELPVTLLLRPLNVETLATWLYGEAARGTYEEGAIAALAIVLAGLLPVIFLARTQPDLGTRQR